MMVEPSYLKDFKAKAAACVQKLEWPTKKDDEWRRTPSNLFPLDRVPTEGGKGSFSSKDYGEYSAVLEVSQGQGKVVHQDSSASQVVFSTQGETSEPWLLQGLEYQLKNCDNKVLASHLAGITSLHGINFPKNSKSDKPVLVLIREDRPGVFIQPHLVVKSEGLSDWNLVLRYESPEKSQILVNAASTFLVEDGARLKVTEVQLLDKTSFFLDHALVDLGRDGVMDHLNVSLGAFITKGRLVVRLTGSGSDLHTRGLFFALGDQHKDLNLIQDHVAEQTSSRALYKGAVRDRARTVFQGLIVVEENAAGTDAYLSNKNLLMNDGARADSLPQLKIDNNDVKCSHGSTTGKVDEEQVFYLESRGLSKQEAKLLIAQGLFADLVDAAPVVIREELEHLVAEAVV